VQNIVHFLWKILYTVF